MKHIFDDFISVWMAVVRTIIGRIFLFISACVVGQWMGFGFISMIFGMSHDAFDWGDLVEMLVVLPFISGAGILGLYGIPFVIIQIICFHQIICEEKNLLHSWFATAYCQVTLTYLFTSIWEERGLLREHTTDFAIAVLVLGGIHAFFAWFMAWRTPLK